MPTFNQLVRKGREVMVKKSTAPALLKSYNSQKKAAAARDSGRFNDEIVPVPVKVKKEIVEFKRDEFPKAGVTADGIAKLRGAFPVGPESPNPEVVHTFEVTGAKETEDKGTQRVTAANASGINDGAAAIVLASGRTSPPPRRRPG